MKKTVAVFALLFVLVPKIAFASWWNPMTWNWLILLSGAAAPTQAQEVVVHEPAVETPPTPASVQEAPPPTIITKTIVQTVYVPVPATTTAPVPVSDPKPVQKVAVAEPAPCTELTAKPDHAVSYPNEPVVVTAVINSCAPVDGKVMVTILKKSQIQPDEAGVSVGTVPVPFGTGTENRGDWSATSTVSFISPATLRSNNIPLDAGTYDLVFTYGTTKTVITIRLKAE